MSRTEAELTALLEQARQMHHGEAQTALKGTDTSIAP